MAPQAKAGANQGAEDEGKSFEIRTNRRQERELKMTTNDLIAKVATRAGELADLSIDALRSTYPTNTETRSELVRICKEIGYSRGQMIIAILLEEFDEEYPKQIEDF